MKVLKNTERRNFTVDTAYYNQGELKNMLESGLITPITFWDDDYEYPEEIVYVVYVGDCDKIDVEHTNDEKDYEADYCVMVTLKNGAKVHVEL